MHKIAILTSGGDSPGMNCAIRAVVRTALSQGLDVYGIKRGYTGLLEGAVEKMDASSVGNIMQRGGTILQTSRCKEFHDPETRKEAANLLRRKNIDGLVVIGGNGSYNGAWLLHEEHGIPVVGIPGTIDNDILGSDYTIGFSNEGWAIKPAYVTDTKVSSYHLYLLRIKGITEDQRDAIIQEIFEHDVSVNVHFQPLPLLTAYKKRGYKMEDYPESYQKYANEISLPVYYNLTDEQVQTIITAVKESVNKIINWKGYLI